jgi:hypothetical protein
MTARTRRSLVVEEAAAVLARTPAALDALLRGLPDDWIGANEGGETWSPFDVVGHLIHGEKTDWMPRVRIILEHGESRPFEKFDRFAQLAASEGRSVDRLLEEFAALRDENVRQLLGLQLSEADLDSADGIPSWAESPCDSYWPRGSRTTSITSCRFRECSPGSTPMKSARGGPTCESSADSRGEE